mgnify:FL=1|jgi:hypothetical protein
MKFAIPFLKKRTEEKEPRASEPQTSSAGLRPSAVPEAEKKPFVVPESANAMPSFSQPVELAQLASAAQHVLPDGPAPHEAASAKAAPLVTPSATPSDNAPPALSETTAEKVLSAAETPKQMESMLMSQEDIIAAYKIFLKRHPETMEVIKPRVGLTGDRVLVDFLSSSEFTSRPEVVNLIFALAKKLLDEQKAKTAQEASASPSTPAAENAQ